MKTTVEANMHKKLGVQACNSINCDNAYDSEDDDKPLSWKLKTNRAGISDSEEPDLFRLKPNRVGISDDDDEKPLSLRVGMPSNKLEISEVPDSLDDEAPLSLRVRKPSAPMTSKKAKIMPEKPLNKGNHTAGSELSAVSRKRGASERCSRQSPAKKSKISKGGSKKKDKNSQYAVSMEAPPQQGKEKKWTTLEHNGVWFPSCYTPHGVKMLYDGKPVDLTVEHEEVATLYAAKMETDYVNNPVFNKNFFEDWRKMLGKDHVIKEFKRCDFKPIHQWLAQVKIEGKEKKKNMTSEEKLASKKQKSESDEKYMWAIVDGVKEPVGNFRVEAPMLFQGRGDSGKMGRLKKRILPSDITINIGKDAPIPECPIPGERWKEVIHDDTVTWLARWDDPVKKNHCKYVNLGASSNIKGQRDMEKYQKARELKNYIDDIRASYTKDLKNKDVTVKQTAVATYLIDKLALRAGNEKDDDEADTCGCCTLKVENVKPIPPNVLELDFLGKDSIRFYQKYEADLSVFKAVEQLRKGKQPQDQLFDKLDTNKLNTHLKKFMPGLTVTAKVFRTFHASTTLNNLLWEKVEGDDVKQKIDFYRNVNKQVAILCNHQRSVPKSHNTSMEKRTEKIMQLKTALSELRRELDQAKKGKLLGQKRKLSTEALENKIVKENEKIRRMELEMESKEQLKTIALNTSKTNYLDPRITVSWCKRNDVPIEKIYSRTDQKKFVWAMDVDPNYRF